MRMTHDHFGDKAGLYVAVPERLLGGLREAGPRPISAEVSGLDGLPDMFDMICGHFGDSSKPVRILSTENMMSAHLLGSSVASPEVAAPSRCTIEALLARARRDGATRGRHVPFLHGGISTLRGSASRSSTAPTGPR